MDFNLHEFAHSDTEWKRGTFWILVASALGIGLETAILIAYRYSALRAGAIWTAGGQNFAVVMVGELCAVAVILACLPRFLSGARLIRVDDLGIHLFYSGRKSEQYLWSDSRISFRMDDYSEHADLAPTWVAYGIYRPYPWNRRSILSKAAFDAVLASARSHGLDVSSLRSNAPWYWRAHVIYRIRGRSGAG